MISIARTDADGLAAVLEEIIALHQAAVRDNVMMSFVAPLSHEKALLYWIEIIKGVADGKIHCFLAKENGRVLGHVLLRLMTSSNQPHVAQISKFLVCKAARGKGIGKRLIDALEKDAKAEGRSLLYLDTAKGSVAEKVYSSLGFSAIGTMPNYGLLPDGSLTDSVFFCKII